jgi:hypothetical protein
MLVTVVLAASLVALAAAVTALRQAQQRVGQAAAPRVAAEQLCDSRRSVRGGGPG